MKTRKQPKDLLEIIPKEILYEEHDIVDFGELVKPALHFDMKTYRKRMAEEKAERKRLRELKKQKKNG